jgi:hypothetical protein
MAIKPLVTHSDAYIAGNKAGRKSLDSGFPRWIDMESEEDDIFEGIDLRESMKSEEAARKVSQMILERERSRPKPKPQDEKYDSSVIHRETGLPTVLIGSAPGREKWQKEFNQGFNDAISRAIKSGEVTIDFRPLLMTFKEVKQAFERHPIGTLSMNHLRVEDPKGHFAWSLGPVQKKGRSGKKTNNTVWITFEMGSGMKRSDMTYEGPIEMSLGRSGKVVICKQRISRTRFSFSTYDVQTSQELNIYEFRS